MAKYEQQCSQVGSFSYASNFKLYIELNDRDGNPNTNKSTVDYNVYCQSSGSGSIRANHDLYFELNGQVIRNENVYVNVSSPNAYIGIASGSIEVEHNSDGSKGIWFSASINATGGYGVSASKADTFWLNNIPRYAEISSAYVESTGLTSAVIRYAVSRKANIYCSVDGQAYGNPRVSNTTDGTFSVTGLSPNVKHNFKILSRATESGLDRETGLFYGTTKDIARITKAPNIEHGNSLKVEYSNASGSKIEIGIWKTDGTTRLTGGYRTCSGNSYTFNFTDEELDNFYKIYGINSNQITVRAFIRTAENTAFIDYKDFTITLKGNQKTAHLLTDKWKRAKMWIKKNGAWKRAIVWIFENSGWKRGM